mgnify:FL=1
MTFNFTRFPTLKSERVLLRPLTFKDTKAVFDLRSSKEINKFIGTKRIESLDESKDFIKVCHNLYEEKKRVFWLIEFNNEVIGSIVLHQISIHNNYAEIGYKLKPEYQHKGLMSEAFKAVLNFGFNNLNLKTIEAFTHKNNLASITLLKRYDFVFQKDRKCNTYDFNRIFKLVNGSSI